MARYALRIEYDGTPFSGWQAQPGLSSVQGAVEAALGRLTGLEHRIAAAGRTDAGVHARGQVCHADLARDWSPFRLSEALNFHLKPLPVAVVDAARVDDDWHARFTAVERRYLYRILTRRAPATLEAGQVWRVPMPLDAAAMQAAAQRLVGQHDFTTFRSVNCQAKSPVKTLDAFEVREVEGAAGPEVHCYLRARSFLHNQVRSFVGSLERVGSGRWSADDLGAALAACDRAACGPVAPPQGLVLVGVGYPVDPFADTR